MTCGNGIHGRSLGTQAAFAESHRDETMSDGRSHLLGAEIPLGSYHYNYIFIGPVTSLKLLALGIGITICNKPLPGQFGGVQHLLDCRHFIKFGQRGFQRLFHCRDKDFAYALALENTVSATQFREGNTYTIFTADQVKDLANHGTYADMTLVITDDIDLGGATIAPIANFEGTIEGSNYTISGYVIDSMSGNNAAFIAVNNGEVRNLTLDGTVKVAFDGKTGNDYKVAGLAAVNNGTIKNVTVKGVVDVESNSLSAFIDIDAAMVAATGNAPVESTAEGTVNVTIAFDLANVTVNAGGLTSTVAADDVTATIDCVNGRTNPIFTTVNIAQ